MCEVQRLFVYQEKRAYTQWDINANQNCLLSPSIVYRLVLLIDIVIIIRVLQRQASRSTRFNQTVVKSSAPSHEISRQSYQG